MRISALQCRAWAKMGQTGTFFGVALPDIAARKENLKLLAADLAKPFGMERFMQTYPAQFLEVGIAEQNMIGIAAGLAMEGDCVFVSSYASFLAVRSLEQIRQNLSHQTCNVKLAAVGGGVYFAKSGVSHWATEDLAFMRAMPNLTVFSAADSLEAVKIAACAADMDGPVYIRLSGGPGCPVVYPDDYLFAPGKIKKLRDGTDVAVIATGLMVAESLKAAQLLEAEGISCSVCNMHTIKPIDQEGLRELWMTHKLLVTVEEHQISGGMGSAVAEYKAAFPNTPAQVMIGFADTFSDAGAQRYVWESNGLTDVQIAGRIKREWESRQEEE